ncbi:MAG: DUF1835 domain-containing protein [Terrimonas ferruginea]|jgi:hypothetical protein|uniref:DUF1835 domain-containing protein n=1 Tax=Terrimonas ferruginea TaxID=249 RepID=UPI000925B766|nr:DUF1835 domain-containing protein [Terrimonas ferruginea]MBN8782808.1 DUF1835 domain-containing protein [Terrimonas ferruginea]OJW44007.1 MAG: hypothetical protein BGO56_19085 [Sphingobacteriales bacterium 48-107]
MLHIVFNESEVALMQQVLELEEDLAGEVWQIKDDFAVGPIQAIYEPEGYQQRRDWWKTLLENSPYAEQADLVDDKLTVHNLKKKLEEEPELEVWIWMGQNQHDVSGYYWLMPQLREFQGRIMVLYMNNLPFINEKGNIFYPSWLHEIRPSEFRKARKLARPITLSEFEVDPDEWKKLCDENAIVRILEGGKKIVSKDETFYDDELLKNVTGEWQKSWRVLSNTLNRMKIKTGDVFIMWRMKQLVQEGKIEVLGDINKGWKEFDVRRPGAPKTETANAAEEQAG